MKEQYMTGPLAEIFSSRKTCVYVGSFNQAREKLEKYSMEGPFGYPPKHLSSELSNKVGQYG